MKVVLVCLGNFQEYILENIRQLKRFHNNDIVVITNREFFPKFSEKVELVACEELDDGQFNHYSRLDRDFRNGFFHFCSLRFFYLHSYMKTHQIQDIIHLENDVMCYENLEALAPKFTESKIYATFDRETCVIPGFLYIPTAESLEPILTNYNLDEDDMKNFGRFQEDVILPLPICSRDALDNHKVTKLFDHFQCIFDAAALGQYLGGVDPRNIPGDTRGFINEFTVIKYNKYPFHWIKNAEGLRQPFLEVGGKFIPVINLHIHCKRLDQFASNNHLWNNNNSD